MISLRSSDSDTIAGFGRELLMAYRSNFASFEQAAQVTTEAIYQNFGESDPLFALVRVFRLCQFTQLPFDVQKKVNVAETNLWMALAGTFGDEPTWRSRHHSQRYQAVPIGSANYPMFQLAFEQLGIKTKGTGELRELHFEKSTSITQYVYVEDVRQSSYITRQEDFVKPYGIQSAVGIASPFASGSFYLCMCFATQSLSREDAVKFTQITPFVSTLLAGYDGHGVLWN